MAKAKEKRLGSVSFDADDYSLADKMWDRFRKVSIETQTRRSSERRTLLRQESISFDYFDGSGKTPLMKAVEKGYIKTTFNLLLFGSNPNLQDEGTGDTALHLAVDKCDILIVKTLLIFNADPTIRNKQNETPLDVAKAIKEEKTTPSIKKALKLTAFVFVSIDHAKKKREIKEEALKGDIDGVIEALTRSRDCQAKSDKYFAENPTVPSCTKNPDEIFLLSFDGGGMRIFNSLQALVNIEERMQTLDPKKKRLHTYFDYIAGTSCGAIAGCTLAYLQTDSYNTRAGMCKGLTTVFSCPYSERADQNDQLLQELYTEERCMSDLNPRYRVIVTSALTDYSPFKLHLMTSYGGSRDGQAGPKERKVWEACRIATSAPSYFPNLRNLRLLDGGLLANNPTLDSMAEIIEQGKREGQKVKFGCVLSIGTGHVTPTPQDEAVEFFATSTLSIFSMKNLHALRSLASHFFHEATLSDGKEVAQASAFCDALGAQYFRLTPPLKEEVDMASADENKLLPMMFEAQMYCLDNPQLIDGVAKCLLSRK